MNGLSHKEVVAKAILDAFTSTNGQSLDGRVRALIEAAYSVSSPLDQRVKDLENMAWALFFQLDSCSNAGAIIQNWEQTKPWAEGLLRNNDRSPPPAHLVPGMMRRISELLSTFKKIEDIANDVLHRRGKKTMSLTLESISEMARAERQGEKRVNL